MKKNERWFFRRTVLQSDRRPFPFGMATKAWWSLDMTNWNSSNGIQAPQKPFRTQPWIIVRNASRLVLSSINILFMLSSVNPRMSFSSAHIDSNFSVFFSKSRSLLSFSSTGNTLCTPAMLTLATCYSYSCDVGIAWEM